MTAALIAILAAPIPGLVVYLLGLRMLRKRDEPAFDEQFWRHRVRVSRMGTFSLGALALFGWRWTPVTIPLFALCVWLGSFPLRKRVFNEEWTLGEYLRSRVRLSLGVTLFWFVLAFEPLLVGSVGSHNFGWVLAVLIFWSYFYREQMLWGLEAGPLTDASLQPRLDAIVAKSRAAKPEVVEIGSPKGHFPNAFASPHARHPRVLLSRTMLRHLEGDEVAAIFAHEIAHLEHYTPKRMRIAGWAFFIVIICGTVLPAAIDPMLAQLVWIIALSIGAALRRRGRQSRETQCDLRAVELCGDRDAFVRALTKLHVLGRVPARQRSQSHPTLEQRIAVVTSGTSRTSRDSADSGLARSSAS